MSSAGLDKRNPSESSENFLNESVLDSLPSNLDQSYRPDMLMLDDDPPPTNPPAARPGDPTGARGPHAPPLGGAYPPPLALTRGAVPDAPPPNGGAELGSTGCVCQAPGVEAVRPPSCRGTMGPTSAKGLPDARRSWMLGGVGAVPALLAGVVWVCGHACGEPKGLEEVDGGGVGVCVGIWASWGEEAEWMTVLLEGPQGSACVGVVRGGEEGDATRPVCGLLFAAGVDGRLVEGWGAEGCSTPACGPLVVVVGCSCGGPGPSVLLGCGPGMLSVLGCSGNVWSVCELWW